MKTCEVIAIPLNEKKMRKCGKKAEHEYNGKPMCHYHYLKMKRRKNGASWS